MSNHSADLRTMDPNPTASRCYGPAEALSAYHKALEQAVRVIKMWHGDDAFDLYFNHSPEMKPIREMLGKMPGEQ